MCQQIFAHAVFRVPRYMLQHFNGNVFTLVEHTCVCIGVHVLTYLVHWLAGRGPHCYHILMQDVHMTIVKMYGIIKKSCVYVYVLTFENPLSIFVDP